MTPDCGDCIRDGMCVAYCARRLAWETGWVPEPNRLTLRPYRKHRPPEPEYVPVPLPPIPAMVKDHMRAEAEATAAKRKWSLNPIDITWTHPPERPISVDMCRDPAGGDTGTATQTQARVTVPGAESLQTLKK
jgi:hypothetical protein